MNQPIPHSDFHHYLTDFMNWQRAMNYAESTLSHRQTELGYFIDWCEARSIHSPMDVTRGILERYRLYIFAYRRQTDGLPLSVKTQGKRLIAVRVWFKWLTRNHHLLFNPASELDLPKVEKTLPRHILTIGEIAQILNSPDTTDPSGLGLRDRAMLETLYSTAMRRSELVNLNLNDVDSERGTVLIRDGKGKKDRMVPIGERALAWIHRYLYEVRPRYLDDVSEPSLFLSKTYARLSGKHLSGIVKKAIDEAHLERTKTSGALGSSCHLFRHACATHMLENGADIRYIQALLGHADLTTTEIYTRVAILKLKEIHSNTHPARLTRQNPESPAATNNTDLKAMLMATLEAELDSDAE